MSTYQYYEFRRIGGTLSDEAMKEVAQLSSRAQVTRTSAVFTYHYGDFRGDAIEVLEKHFDLLFYTANWGSRRLAFRFPSSAVDPLALDRFAMRQVIQIKRQDPYMLVDLDLHDENLGDSIEGEGQLDRLAGLYDDLLAGDYRALLLVWMVAVALGDGKDSKAKLPPIPPGLGQLAERHRALIEVFGVNPDLVAVIEPFSAPLRAIEDAELVRALATVPAGEQTRFLERFILGESPSVLIAELRRTLRNHARAGEAPAGARPPAPPSVRLLFTRADELRADREREEKARAAEQERQRLEKIEREEPRLWLRVDELIAAKNIKAYDEAVGFLKNLRDLAAHKDRRDEFVRKIEAIRAKHPRMTGLLWRIEQAKLV